MGCGCTVGNILSNRLSRKWHLQLWFLEVLGNFRDFQNNFENFKKLTWRDSPPCPASLCARSGCAWSRSPSPHLKDLLKISKGFQKLQPTSRANFINSRKFQKLHFNPHLLPHLFQSDARSFGALFWRGRLSEESAPQAWRRSPRWSESRFQNVRDFIHLLNQIYDL